MKCAWCDRQDDLVSVEIEPARYQKRYEPHPVTGRGELIEVMTSAPVRAMVCPQHAGIVFDPSANVTKIRRRPATGYCQTTIFDQLPEEQAREAQDHSALHQGTR